MYNDLMTMKGYQILLCNSCGLRYPHVQGQSFGRRCPVCMGETRVILSRKLVLESNPDLTPIPHSEGHTSPKKRGGYAVLLDNIRSAWNVGSIFRSAEGFSFGHAYLCGITPTLENEAVVKTSLGAEDSVTWSYHKDAVKLVKGLKKEGWKIWALEDDERAKEIVNAECKRQNVVLIVGNEVTGVDPELLDLCNEVFYIPMRGEKKSFNVGVAFGIASYAFVSYKQ